MKQLVHWIVINLIILHNRKQLWDRNDCENVIFLLDQNDHPLTNLSKWIEKLFSNLHLVQVNELNLING